MYVSFLFQKEVTCEAVKCDIWSLDVRWATKSEIAIIDRPWGRCVLCVYITRS